MHYIKQLTAIMLLSMLTLTVFASESNKYNRVTFQVTEQKDVSNDEITVTMSIERDNQDAKKLADDINQLTRSANTTIKEFPAISSSTSDYSIRPIYTRDNRLDHWRGSSSITLKSQDNSEMAALVQILQNTMAIQSTRYSVSPDRKEKIHTSMIETALKKFNGRAQLVSKSMGFKKFRLVDININNSGNLPRPVYAMAAAREMSDSTTAAPSFESGTTTLTVNISGTIEMEVAP